MSWREEGERLGLQFMDKLEQLDALERQMKPMGKLPVQKGGVSAPVSFRSSTTERLR